MTPEPDAEARADEPADRGRLTRLAWFAGLWLAGVGALGIIAMSIRYALS